MGYLQNNSKKCLRHFFDDLLFKNEMTSNIPKFTILVFGIIHKTKKNVLKNKIITMNFAINIIVS